MRATGLYFDRCPRWGLTGERLRHAADHAAVGHVEVELVCVGTREEALERPIGPARRRILGAPGLCREVTIRRAGSGRCCVADDAAMAL
jgi:hypothetical protein